MKTNCHYVYFIKSLVNGKTYVGSTAKHPTTRLKEHNLGANTWSKANKPFGLVYFEEYTCNKCARMREKFYKSGIGRQLSSIIIEGIEQIKSRGSFRQRRIRF